MLKSFLKLQLVSPVSVGLGGPFSSLFSALSGIHSVIPFWALCPLWCLILVPLTCLFPVILPIYLLFMLQKSYKQRGIPNYYDPYDAKAICAAQTPEEAQKSTIAQGENFNSLAEQRAAHAKAASITYRKLHQSQIDAPYDRIQGPNSASAPAPSSSSAITQPSACNELISEHSHECDLMSTQQELKHPGLATHQAKHQAECSNYNSKDNQAESSNNHNAAHEECGEIYIDASGKTYFGVDEVEKFEQLKQAQEAEAVSQEKSKAQAQAGDNFKAGAENKTEIRTETKDYAKAQAENSNAVTANSNESASQNNQPSSNLEITVATLLAQSSQDKDKLVDQDCSNQENAASITKDQLAKAQDDAHESNGNTGHPTRAMLHAVNSALNTVVHHEDKKQDGLNPDQLEAQKEAQIEAQEEAFDRAAQAQDHSEFVDGFLIKPCSIRQNIDNFIRLNIIENILQNKYLIAVSQFIYWLAVAVVIYGMNFFATMAIEKYRASAMRHQVLQIVTPEQLEYADTMVMIFAVGGSIILVAMLLVFAMTLVGATGCLYPKTVASKVILKNIPGFVVISCLMYAVCVIVERYYAHYVIIAYEDMILGREYFNPAWLFVLLRLYIVFAFLTTFVLTMIMSLKLLPGAFVFRPKPNQQSGSRTQSAAYSQDLARREYASWQMVEMEKAKTKNEQEKD